MTVFFVIISFIFNIISIMAIIILFLRQNKLIQVEANQKRAIMELEELMSSYLLEMKDENERFIERVKKINEDQFSTLYAKEKMSDPKAEHTASRVKQHEYIPRIESAVNYQAVKAYQKQKKSQPDKKVIEERTDLQVKGIRPVDEEDSSQIKESIKDVPNNELLKESLLFQILIMKQQGFTIEEIAKRLNKGKSEIALLLKFHENHQE